MTNELFRAAERLRFSEYFVNCTDDYPLVEKWAIFLALTGDKPVSDVSTSHWVWLNGTTREARGDDPNEVKNFLDSLGLASHVSRLDVYATRAVVSRRHDLVERLLTVSDDREAGLLLGYPPTAVDAFVGGARLPEREAAAMVAARGLPLGLDFFFLSHAHAAEELDVVQGWQQVLMRYGLL